MSGEAKPATDMNMSERRKELSKLARKSLSADWLNAASCVEDLETPIEAAAKAAGVTTAELRHAASHPYDPTGYLVTMTLLAEGEPARHESESALPKRLTDRADLLALGRRDYAALTQQALLAGVTQPELSMAREHRYDRVGYLATLTLVAQQEKRHLARDLSSISTRRISMRATRHQQPVQPSWIVDRLHSEGLAGTR